MNIQWHHYNSLSSTNTTALDELSLGKLVEGDVIWTDEQRNGKGNGENTWESEAGKNLTFSFILEPQFIEPQAQFIITQAISVALQQLLSELIPQERCSIKWPNDLYVNHKKIGGILIQNLIKGNTIAASVVGVGLNINQKVFYSDAPNPVSLIHFTKQETSLFPLLKEVVFRMAATYKSLQKAPLHKVIKKSYLEALFQKDRWASYADGRGTFEGKIKDIDEYGRLRLLDRSNHLRTYAFKEIRFIF
jgi:BirA family biotin operon repressor/biotin-[acetyl-CoA-carboxylase] ligase